MFRCRSNQLRLAPVKRETGANPVRTRHRDREQEPQNHWETGKMADAMILSRETCLNAVQKRKFPNMRVYLPSDRFQTAKLIEALILQIYLCTALSLTMDQKGVFLFVCILSFFLMTAGKIMVGSKSFLAALYLI